MKSSRFQKEREHRWVRLLWFIGLPLLLICVVVVTVLITLSVKKTEELSGYTYYDNYMNFSFTIPEGWAVANPDTEEVRNSVFEATDGVLFDMVYHRLPKEVVPVSLVSTEGKRKSTKLNSTKFFTLAFRGSDEEHTYLQDLQRLSDEFKSMLQILNYTQIRIVEVVDLVKIGDKELQGVLLKASANVGEGIIVNYLQYLEPAGNNIMIANYGSTQSHLKGLKELKRLLRDLRYYEGGQYISLDEKDRYTKDEYPEEQSVVTPNDPSREIEVHEGGHFHSDGTWHADAHDDEGEERSGGHYHSDGTWHTGETHSDNESPSPKTSESKWKVVESDTQSGTKYSGGHFHEDGSWHPEPEHSDDEVKFVEPN